jgi:hypothetical protein
MSKIPTLFAIIFLSLSLSKGQNITVSKDSLRIYNNPMSSSADEVIFTSHTSTAVALDSAFITVAQMDTAGLTAVIAAKSLQAVWTGYTPTAANYQWLMDSVSPNTYKLKINYSSSSSPPLSFSGNNATSQIFRFQIGACFYCGRLPEYPKYFKGTLRLFFSNGQVIELKLWSQDLRTRVRPKDFSTTQPSNSRRFGVPEGVSTSSRTYRYLANGKRVFASNRATARKNQIFGTTLYEKRN